MSTLNEAMTGTSTPLERLELALKQELAGGKTKLELDFKEAYPVLALHIARKVRKRLLMEGFNDAYRHTLNLIQFRKLLNAERARREAAGDLIACTSCAQPLTLADEGVNGMEIA